MTDLHYTPLPSDIVAALQAGVPDAYGIPAERAISDGDGNPCRHCLHDIPAGAGMLILAHRPFAGLHPYAETGPIFLCADACTAWHGQTPPPILKPGETYLIKGYTADERIRYGTGQIVPTQDLSKAAAALLARDEIAFVDLRSARNNCFQLRIRRA
ncbi:DUF1203 domain-containing protein [Sulfitobacter albidus]|uniref:DUF1203 domain-containing protein n=1 Tax=Sulfitobacter albidus TaxID=2829501 RepID=A0A975JCA8_9RHOB|nr:DUF1203 domain-containing protein [Sulfitobacter albidus]QUJ75450.1 DUF1203 domain-containing protein [Sulfitobacter albidus]